MSSVETALADHFIKFDAIMAKLDRRDATSGG